MVALPPVVVDTNAPAMRSLRIVVRDAGGVEFALAGKDSYIIGRRDDAAGIVPDIDLSGLGPAARGISRRHAVIHCGPDGLCVEDLESANETIHNGYRLLPRQRYRLVPGDVLALGAIVLTIESDTSRKDER